MLLLVSSSADAEAILVFVDELEAVMWIALLYSMHTHQQLRVRSEALQRVQDGRTAGCQMAGCRMAAFRPSFVIHVFGTARAEAGLKITGQQQSNF